MREVSQKDQPLPESAFGEDPYCEEPAMCILCPRRYEEPIPIDYKNPKLLAQFVSPHTGMPYRRQVTGLCSSMQERVDAEIRKAQGLGELIRRVFIYMKTCPLLKYRDATGCMFVVKLTYWPEVK